MKEIKNRSHKKIDNRGVSPVIGVILMVAITVILAAVVSVFVLGIGDTVSETTPQASFTFDFDEENETVTVTHTGGTTIDSDRIEVVAGDNTGTWSSDSVSSGSVSDSVEYESGDEVRVVWTSQDGQSSNILAERTAP